jgi:predicted transcriptional regulator|tara:strand:+ start:208 stop:480 length:273 start_codon:yes stop_codon:yes gene_type:complete
MYFNKWVQSKIEQLSITRKHLSDISGISYSSIALSKKFQPRIVNLVLVCEVLNEEQGGDKSSLDALILEAIRVSSREYRYAMERLEEVKR